MAGGVTVGGLMNSIFETKSESVTKQKPVLDSEKENSKQLHTNKLFGRQKSVHILLGGGKSADVLLWRNKKISGGILASATAIWVLLLWLNHHILSLVCFAMVLGLLAQFFWSHTSVFLYSSPPKAPRVVLPEDLLVHMTKSVAVEINRALAFLQNVACGGNIKHFLAVIVSLSAAAIIGSFCNFLTLVYIGFVATQTLPVLYEKYEDQVDIIFYNIFDQLQQQFQGKKHD